MAISSTATGEHEKVMTEQITIAPIITLEQAIQRLIHDHQIPEKLRTALAAYQGMGSDLRGFEIRMPWAEQTDHISPPKTSHPSPAGGYQDGSSRSAADEYHYILNCADAVLGWGINIVLVHNKESFDWSVTINGLCHEHVTSEVMEALVECALIIGQMSLTRALAQRPQ
jgi:hypothetical protein